jgi:RES domain-containing protein
VISAWRIVKRKHLKNAFTGEGARLFGGRWNSPGHAVVYTAQSQALAALELLVHLESPELLRHYVALEVQFPGELMEEVDHARLPKNWSAYPPPVRLQEIGDAWIAERRSVVLRVPSAVVPAESNYLLNPAHPDFTRLPIGEPAPFRFDPRLRR